MSELYYHYNCVDCGSEFSPERFIVRCPLCSGVLLLKQELTSREKQLREIFDFTITDMWKYAPLLPVHLRDGIDTLGEGGTPLILSRHLSKRLGLSELVLKNETTNPTGSFKDRQVAVGMYKALELEKNTVAVISSGNVAASASALAARLGLSCLVFVPAAAPNDKLIQAGICGARVFKVRTESSSLIMELVEEACEKTGWFNLSTAGSKNPFTVEGAKTVAYELYEQTRGLMPDVVFIPVGGGGLLGGLWNGIHDLLELGLIDSSPRLVGVQSAGCAPLVEAVKHNITPAEVMATPWKNPATVAGGIADDILFDAHRALTAVRDSGGTAITVSDEEILAAVKLLATDEGIFAEPTGAVSLAGMMASLGRGLVIPSQRLCCLVTGAGFKDMRTARHLTRRAPVIEPRLNDIVNSAK